MGLHTHRLLYRNVLQSQRMVCLSSFTRYGCTDFHPILWLREDPALRAWGNCHFGRNINARHNLAALSTCFSGPATSTRATSTLLCPLIVTLISAAGRRASRERRMLRAWDHARSPSCHLIDLKSRSNSGKSFVFQISSLLFNALSQIEVLLRRVTGGPPTPPSPGTSHPTIKFLTTSSRIQQLPPLM